MKKLVLLSLIPFLLISCKNKENEEEKEKSYADYGAFLGRSDNDVTSFNEYDYVSVELYEYTKGSISRLTNHGTKFLAYLNVGSLEDFREGQEEYAENYELYESFIFKDYDNWPGERWIDVSHVEWQNFLINTLARDFKDLGAYGVYLDNVDVYTIAKEENLNYSSFASGLKNIIKGVSDLGLKVLVNGGSEFLDDMNDQDDSIFDSIWAYHQEEVFSLILDYEKNEFGTQEEEDRVYYQEISSFMKEKGKEVFYLEYTTDSDLKNTIKDYCQSHHYHYYFASDIELL